MEHKMNNDPVHYTLVSNATLLRRFIHTSTGKIRYRDYMNLHMQYNMSHAPSSAPRKLSRMWNAGCSISSPQADVEELHSYTRNQFNYGFPFRGGASPRDKIVLNNIWDNTQESKDCQIEDSYDPAFFKLRMDIGEREDKLTDIDINYTRNQRICRQFSLGFNYVEFNEILAEELNAIYPNRGYYMLSMLKQYPKIVFPIIHRRINERRKELFIEKFENQVEMGKEFETTTPALRALCIRDPLVFPEKLGPYRLFTFQNQTVIVLKKYLNILSESILTERVFRQQKMDVFQTMMNCLTKQGFFSVNYQIAILIALTSSLITEILKIDFIDSNSNNIDNAIRIGITENSNHRHSVILKYVKNISSLKESDDIIYEIGGFMKNVDLKKACIIATIAFSIQHFLYQYISTTNHDNNIVNITNKSNYQGISIIFNQDMKVSVPEEFLALKRNQNK